VAITVTVYYSNGLKRGPECTNATFGQWVTLQSGDILFPAVRKLIDLSVGAQNGNQYEISPQTAPLDPASNHVELRVNTVGEGRGRPFGSADFVAENGREVEVWI
jgi:hypothetical protein